MLKRNFDITNYSNFKTKAICNYYYEINTVLDIEKLSEIIAFWKINKLKILFIWWWTNMLFAFDVYNWIIIKNNLKWWEYNKNTKILKAFSWEMISDIAISLLKDYKVELWKRFIWLPWTVWWAVYWNAWCFWLETENNFFDAEIYDIDNNIKMNFNKSKMKFSYRSSILKEENNFFLINSRFDFNKKIEKYDNKVDNIYFRENKQPKWNTCWSFFKNPNKEMSAWLLIEKVWLKWYKEDTAYFSDLHANFLMSEEWGNYKDLLDLILLAQKKVKNNFNIDLVPEVKIVYN